MTNDGLNWPKLDDTQLAVAKATLAAGPCKNRIAAVSLLRILCGLQVQVSTPFSALFAYWQHIEPIDRPVPIVDSVDVAQVWREIEQLAEQAGGVWLDHRLYVAEGSFVTLLLWMPLSDWRAEYQRRATALRCLLKQADDDGVNIAPQN